MTESTPNYSNFTNEDLKNTTDFLCGMITEATDERWKNGLYLELGKLTYQLSQRTEDDSRT